MSSHASRKFVVKPAAPMNSEINVTPLVDVVLVLLIIFMVVTPLLEKDIGVRVPQTEEAPDPDAIPPDQLVVRVNAAGELTVNWEKVAQPDLAEYLRTRLDKRRKPEDKIVFISADDGANYGSVVAVLDSAKAAGATVLGMATEKDESGANAPAPAPAPPAPAP
ncbi:MAG: biopolymer transporter ExbD [Polyangiaceae bacterium]|nr:biopolymer transporter ExbD [Polyangiaceae bacterium]